MKKLALVIALAMVVSMFAAISASAFYTGESASEQKEFTVPKVNANNPAIVIDGVVDLDGEWYGAVNAGIDLTNEEAALDFGFWDSNVWVGDSFPVAVENYYDIPEDMLNKWDVYYLWDEAGLYFAVVCETDSTVSKFNPQRYIDGAAIEGQSRRVDGFTPMIRPSDDEADPYEWLEFWTATYDGTSYWNDDNFIYYKGNSANAFEISYAATRETTANEAGAYPYYMEAFIPWDALCYGTGADKVVDINAEAGLTIMIGQIFLDGDGIVSSDDPNPDQGGYWGRGFDCPGWGAFNYYMMSATPAAAAPASEEPAAEEPAVEEPAVEEPAVEEPAVEEPAVDTTPAPSNPTTADVSVIFYALAAISAVGGISIFKRK